LEGKVYVDAGCRSGNDTIKGLSWVSRQEGLANFILSVLSFCG